MTESRPVATASDHTAWTRNLQTPLRRFVGTETGSAAVAARPRRSWPSSGRMSTPASYQAVWHTLLSSVRRRGLRTDQREWVNSGLMTFFFFVVGLEARREFDLGELRERRRLTMPLLAGIGGMLVPRRSSWSSTRAAVGARLGPGDVHRHRVGAGHPRAGRPALPDRLRVFLLTFASWTTSSRWRHRHRLQHASSCRALLIGLRSSRVVLLVRAPGTGGGLVYSPARHARLVRRSASPASTRSWSGWPWA